MVFQVQIPIGSLPISLILVGDKTQGSVAFVKSAPFQGAIFDLDTQCNIRAAFYEENFVIYHPHECALDGEFAYNYIYDYKSIPVMLEWLKEQNLQEPNTIFG